MAQLRQKTAEMHQRVEKKLGMNRLSDRETYEAVLRAFFGFYGSVESPLLQKVADILPDREQRKKTEWLKQDLNALGLPAKSIQDLPRATSLNVTSPAQAMGALYVLEGSTLGGAYIAAHIQKTLGIDSESGGRFFMNYGSERQTMWERFRTQLTGFATTEAQEAEVLSGAMRAFAHMETWLEQTL